MVCPTYKQHLFQNQLHCGTVNKYFAHGSNGWGVIVIAPAREARAGLAPRKPLISFNNSGQTEASNVSLGMRMIPVSISNLSLGGK